MALKKCAPPCFGRLQALLHSIRREIARRKREDGDGGAGGDMDEERTADASSHSDASASASDPRRKAGGGQ